MDFGESKLTLRLYGSQEMHGDLGYLALKFPRVWGHIGSGKQTTATVGRESAGTKTQVAGTALCIRSAFSLEDEHSCC